MKSESKSQDESEKRYPNVHEEKGTIVIAAGLVYSKAMLYVYA
jgi:hypothetical protein